MIPMWKRPWMSAAEYRANLQGFNVFFGAVLGVVLAGTGDLGPRDHGVLLFLMATLVVTILYVTSSRHRLVYALLALGLIAFLPRLVDEMIDATVANVQHLQVTLAVWVGMAIFIEFTPRERDERRSVPDDS